MSLICQSWDPRDLPGLGWRWYLLTAEPLHCILLSSAGQSSPTGGGTLARWVSWHAGKAKVPGYAATHTGYLFGYFILLTSFFGSGLHFWSPPEFISTYSKLYEQLFETNPLATETSFSVSPPSTLLVTPVQVSFADSSSSSWFPVLKCPGLGPWSSFFLHLRSLDDLIQSHALNTICMLMTFPWSQNHTPTCLIEIMTWTSNRHSKSNVPKLNSLFHPLR